MEASGGAGKCTFYNHCDYRHRTSHLTGFDCTQVKLQAEFVNVSMQSESASRKYKRFCSTPSQQTRYSLESYHQASHVVFVHVNLQDSSDR